MKLTIQKLVNNLLQMAIPTPSSPIFIQVNNTIHPIRYIYRTKTSEHGKIIVISPDEEPENAT